MLDENFKTLIDEYTESEYIRGQQKARIDMLIDIVYMNARKQVSGERKYLYERSEMKIDADTILAIFQRDYTKDILDSFEGGDNK